MRKQEDANLASEFYVASQLYRLGYVTVLTLGHTKKIDLVVIHPDGRTVTIDVKGLKHTTNWPLQPKLKKKEHFYILVNYKGKFKNLTLQPEVFVIPSFEIDNLLSSWAGKPEVKCVEYKDIKDSKYRDAWDLLFSLRRNEMNIEVEFIKTIDTGSKDSNKGEYKVILEEEIIYQHLDIPKSSNKNLGIDWSRETPEEFFKREDGGKRLVRDAFIREGKGKTIRIGIHPFGYFTIETRNIVKK